MEIRPFSFDTIFILTFVGAYPSRFNLSTLPRSPHITNNEGRGLVQNFEENALEESIVTKKNKLIFSPILFSLFYYFSALLSLCHWKNFLIVHVYVNTHVWRDICLYGSLLLSAAMMSVCIFHVIMAKKFYPIFMHFHLWDSYFQWLKRALIVNLFHFLFSKCNCTKMSRPHPRVTWKISSIRKVPNENRPFRPS